MPNPFLTKKLEKQAPLKSAPNEEIQQAQKRGKAASELLFRTEAVSGSERL